MEETISLQELIQVLKKRLVLIVSVAIFAVIIAAVASYYFMTPVYQSSTQILVNQQTNHQDEYNSQEIKTNLQLINTYKVIIESPVILSKVIENLDLDTTPSSLATRISVNSAQDSQVVSVNVEDTKHHRAVDISNTTAEVFKEEVQHLMNVDNVNILSPAVHVDHPSPIKPNPKLNIAIATVMGFMVGVGIAFLLEYLDTTVKTESDIEELLDLPILGLVSPIAGHAASDAIRTPSRRQRKGRRSLSHVQKEEKATSIRRT